MDDRIMLEKYKANFIKSVQLYTNGVLVQYGLTDEQALDITANLTGLSKETLKAEKEARDRSLNELFGKANEQVLGALGIYPKGYFNFDEEGKAPEFNKEAHGFDSDGFIDTETLDSTGVDNHGFSGKGLR
ncbi:MAG: hypothetical protein IKF36_00105 [Bacilli bacterium]|nr:hypothetical protein [Bacilli bacterium]